MTDPPGLPSALGIETVEWFAQEESAETVTVRVTGRWRRRRPISTAQPMLVVEVHGYRHRYPAMPEPPSLSGTAPGTWRISFAVPAWIAPYLSTRATLQMGGAVVPLPAQVGPGAPPSPMTEEGVLAERRAQSAELVVEAARRRAREAEERAADLARDVERLGHELVLARHEPARLRDLLAEAERAARAAEQRAHAELRRREDLEEELGRRSREHSDAERPRAELAAALARIRELESELEALRRRLEEASHHAAAAVAARQRAEWEARRGAQQAVMRGIRAELAVAFRSPPAPPPSGDAGRGGGGVAGAGLTSRTLSFERSLIAARASRTARGTPEDTADPTEPPPAELAARIAELEQDLAEQAARSARAYEAIERLRASLRAAPPPEPARGYEIDPAGKVEPERLEAALSRLRERSLPEPPPAEPTTRASLPWLRSVLSTLLERDPAAAGELAIVLLPAQRLVHPRPLAYDVVLGERDCVQVTVAGSVCSVERHESSRPAEATHFRVEGDPAGFARFLVRGRVRRGVRRLGVRVSGDREAARGLLALLTVPLSVPELIGAGCRLEPCLSLAIVAAAVSPSWTRGESFSVRYSAAARVAWLMVRDGARVSWGSGDPPEPAGTTIACPSDALLALLDGAQVSGAEIDGDPRPLTLLQGWMKRAQSG